MPIPNAISAFVPPDKLSGYLLDETHPVGGSKAKWFRALGFDPAHSQILEQAILSQVQASDEFFEKSSLFGTKYVVSGTIQSPTGKTVNLVSVWIVEPTDPRPRLVTAYPGDKP